jgi:hypothetical protein
VDTREIALGERADAELQRLGAAAHETKCWRVAEGPVFQDVRTKGFSSEQGSDDPQSTTVEDILKDGPLHHAPLSLLRVALGSHSSARRGTQHHPAVLCPWRRLPEPTTPHDNDAHRDESYVVKLGGGRAESSAWC